MIFEPAPCVADPGIPGRIYKFERISQTIGIPVKVLGISRGLDVGIGLSKICKAQKQAAIKKQPVCFLIYEQDTSYKLAPARGLMRIHKKSKSN
jgi:hypothetical protein